MLKMFFLSMLTVSILLSRVIYIYSYNILLIFRIRRAGYPIRHSFKVFASRYHMLVIGLGDLTSRNPKEATKLIALNAISDSDWQIGHNKIFLKA